MQDKQKAFTIGALAILVLAGAMFAYYRIASRARVTENDVNLEQPVERAKKEDKGEFSGVYSAQEPVEGSGKRLAFFAVSKRDDGSYGATGKLDTIGGDATDGAVMFTCDSVTINEKDFFLKCADPAQGRLSFSGEWSRAGNGIQVAGSVLWSKDGTPLIDKRTTLHHMPE